MKTAALAAAVLMAGCGGPEGVPTPFIALERDFVNYPSWESAAFETTVPVGVVDQGHTGGPRRVYLNRRPAAGATEFPVGTIIVKELTDDTFGMVKRGGGYNADGAVGWEWFGLERDGNGTTRIRWRGLGAPLGSEYGPMGETCNVCHGGARALDSVLTPEFRLSVP